MDEIEVFLCLFIMGFIICYLCCFLNVVDCLVYWERLFVVFCLNVIDIYFEREIV